MYRWKFWDLSDIDIEKYNYRINQPELTDNWGNTIDSEYFQGVQGCYQYAYDVLKGIRYAGAAEIAMCERFIYDIHRQDLFFDESEVNIVVGIVNELRHPKGVLGGTRFFLMHWMIFILANVFGFYYTKQARHGLIGSRRFIKSSVFVARGNSKTVLAAAIAIVNSLFTTNTSPVCTTSATTTKQSRIAFEDISKMIRSASPSIKKRFKCLQNEIRVLHNDGKIFPTSKQSGSLDGIRVVTGILDEIHAHPDSSIVDVISTGTQSSKDPILFMISTAGENSMSYGREIFDYTKEIAKNQVENDRFFACAYCPNDDDIDKWDEERVWETANPALGHAVILESLRAAYNEATRNAKARANFLTKHLNVFVDFDEDNFVDVGELISCRNRTLNITDYKGKPCYLGVDLAGVSDLSSLVYIFPNDSGGVDVFQKSYLPETVTNGIKPSLRDRYYKAHKDGELVFTIGEVTDFEYIKNDIINAYEMYDVKALSIDGAAGGIRFASELEEHHIDAVAVKQGFGLSETAILLQSLIKSNKFAYNSDLLEWCYTNALQVEGTYGDIKVIRPKKDLNKKIDICIATLIGLSQTILQEDKYSVYEHKELRFI
ncbi:terminase large subunit [Vibrio parahaemolyticus]|nr:terminase large subunit [Vibrio parahaemolyticus]EJG0013012.1 terminase large subunit [Vibrio parahaemolyticus]EJS9799249.1 terminase large subunit [Vibrio parahaemolyticus]